MLNKLMRVISGLSLNGKSLVVWVLNEWPGITDYPGIKEAIMNFIKEPTQSHFGHLLFQLLWAFAAGHRAVKLLRAT